ncbi:efflux RND transporter periplasmic adaptor subunit [Gallaecimonas mangrovi]|uniref:efflux RND transporter periplasmic adaptor subunit n=1 Tax=Gallaecimonas mangrovi TaxID=2291597 RepID=UPI000E2099F9|nr:efflux RND transporter periplasmic adaptor subunit [Gallaecimonas mangrovi]
MNNRRRALLVTAAAVLVLLLVIFWIGHAMTHRAPLPKQKVEVVYPRVTVSTVQPHSYTAQVKSYGEVKAHFSLTLTSEVAGTIDSLASDFETGAIVTKGSELAKINDVKYRQALASAKASESSSYVSLLEEQREGKQALAEWQRSGLSGKPDSPLLLRKPQLQSAQAAYDSAKNDVAEAERNLELTRIKAPFKAIVVSRDISPGSYISAGGTVATLYSADRVEVSLPLSGEQWAQLPDPSQLLGAQVNLINAAGDGQWQGLVNRVERSYGSARQRNLVVAVQAPFEKAQPLMPGIFVTGLVPGKQVDGLLKVPASAISNSGEIWYVKAGNLLGKFPADVKFAIGSDIYIRPPSAQDSWKILIAPLDSYLPDMHVNPMEASDQ